MIETKGQIERGIPVAGTLGIDEDRTARPYENIFRAYVPVD